MKAYKINKDSWHYKFLTGFGEESFYGTYSICYYLRKLIWHGLIAIGIGFMIAVMASLAIVVIGSTMIYIYDIVAVNFFGQQWTLDDSLSFFQGAGTLGAFLLFCSLIYWAFCKICGFVIWSAMRIGDSLEESEEETKQSSFIVESYRSIKDKTCVKLEFVDGDR